jgi:hypothetical protein
MYCLMFYCLKSRIHFLVDFILNLSIELRFDDKTCLCGVVVTYSTRYQLWINVLSLGRTRMPTALFLSLLFIVASSVIVLCIRSHVYSIKFLSLKPTLLFSATALYIFNEKSEMSDRMPSECPDSEAVTSFCFQSKNAFDSSTVLVSCII